MLRTAGTSKSLAEKRGGGWWEWVRRVGVMDGSPGITIVEMINGCGEMPALHEASRAQAKDGHSLRAGGSMEEQTLP